MGLQTTIVTGLFLAICGQAETAILDAASIPLSTNLLTASSPSGDDFRKGHTYAIYGLITLGPVLPISDCIRQVQQAESETDRRKAQSQRLVGRKVFEESISERRVLKEARGFIDYFLGGRRAMAAVWEGVPVPRGVQSLPTMIPVVTAIEYSGNDKRVGCCCLLKDVNNWDCTGYKDDTTVTEDRCKKDAADAGIEIQMA